MTAVVGSLAGCSGLTEQEFVADAVVLPADAQSRLGMSAVVEQPQRSEIERTVGGQDVKATVESFVSVYARDGSDGTQGADGPDGDESFLSGFVGSGEGSDVFAGPSTAFDVAGGTAPFLDGDDPVDPRGIVLFASGAALRAGRSIDPGNVLAVAHRSAFEGAESFVAGEAGALFPDGHFFPDTRFFPEKPAWLPDEPRWESPGDAAVAFFAGGDADVTLPDGQRFEAGAELDAEFVAAPADAFFDPGVSVTDPDRMAKAFGFDPSELVVTDPDRMARDAGLVVFSDGERGVPFAYFPGSEWFPDSTFFPDGYFAGDRQVLAAPLGELFPDDFFFPDGYFFPDDYVTPKSLALFFPSKPLDEVPEPFAAVESGAEIAPSETLLFAPAAFPDGYFFPDSTFFPDGYFFPDTIFFPDSSFFPDTIFAEASGDVAAVASSKPSEAFPDTIFFPDSSFAPTAVLHFPGRFGFSTDTFAEGGGPVAYRAQSGSMADVNGGELGGALSVGVLSTPAASVAGQSLNPLARLGLSDLLTNPGAESFLGSAGVGSGDVNWERGPTRLATGETTVLGEATALETYAGVLGGAEPSVVYLHLARVENGKSVVVAAGVHGGPVADTGRPFVGADGYLSRSELDEHRADVAAVDEALVVR
ncbi:hypothetical protein KTS45_15910 [Halomicroarcula limicola]|uniref:Uncharacterized protein n=1 Tax=Haloarcula limicola TaxID=1429915 RepID=A0A8J7YCE1_9EURY|nr:DUF6517 family protein [Halomicroarcula limicola]MBV0925689.1 hypothetical protein [Halomicroarcula limicola]